MTKKEQQFVATVWEYYRTEGRHALPWRQTHSPYTVLVSELMLQQTQVERVIPKYDAFLQQWPTVEQLAKASLGEVLIAWQGLGYNRRAKFLHQCAQAIVYKYAGVFPQTREELEALPGIGPYTAGALLAFAYNQPVVLIETNVRRVYLHHFFPDAEQVTDADIFPYIEKTLPRDSARDWYAALMDYGTHLKKTVLNPNRRSKHYTKQSPFKGSDREIRGAILKTLTASACSQKKLKKQLTGFESARLDEQLHALLAEGLIMRTKNTYSLKH